MVFKFIQDQTGGRLVLLNTYQMSHNNTKIKTTMKTKLLTKINELFSNTMKDKHLHKIFIIERTRKGLIQKKTTN